MNLRAVVPAQGGHDGRLGAAGKVRGRWRAREQRPRAFRPRRCRGSVLASMPGHVARATRVINTATGEWRPGARLARAPGQAQKHCLPEGEGGGGDTRPPRVQATPGSAAEVRHGEQVEQRGAERDAEKKASTAPDIALREAPLHGFQHRGHGVDLLLQSRCPLAGLLREPGKARLQPGNPFTQLCHWVSKAA